MKAVFWKDTKKRLALLASFALVLLFFCLLPRSAYAQAVAPQAEQEETLETLGSQIHTSLGDLKARCQTLTAELEEQSAKAEALRTKLTDLNSCLTATNNTLCDYEAKLIVYEGKLKSRAKVIWAAAIVLLINILGKVAAIVLRFKGIKLPEAVNILW